MSSSSYFHTRVRIPYDDDAVIEWIKTQHNVSTSLRLLIRADISRHGMSDILSRPPVVGGVERADPVLTAVAGTRTDDTEKPVVQKKASSTPTKGIRKAPDASDDPKTEDDEGAPLSDPSAFMLKQLGG